MKAFQSPVTSGSTTGLPLNQAMYCDMPPDHCQKLLRYSTAFMSRLRHFLEQEVESLPQGLIDGVGPLHDGRRHRAFQRAGFGNRQHAQVPDALRRELIELLGEARAIAGGAGRTQVHAVPEIGARRSNTACRRAGNAGLSP